jgi:predicted enzyme related to lactoylglutathione lyase
MTSPVIHFEIGGRDLGRMTSFYGELFGWQLQPAGPEYSLVPAGDDGIGIGGGLMQTRGEMPPYLTVYVAVDNLRSSRPTFLASDSSRCSETLMATSSG